MQSSIKDVARLSAVSAKTVSRVINGEPNVTAATRERVEAAIAALGYAPDHAARSLRSRHTRTLRLVVVRRFERFLTEPFLDEVVSGIVDRAAAAGYALLLEVSGADGRPVSTGGERGRVDGAILIDGRSASPFLTHGGPSGVPMVALPTRPADANAAWVYADFLGGAERVVEHLIALGHRRILHLAGRLSLPERDRSLGYRRALAAGGIPFDLDLVVAAGHLRHHGYAAMEKALARGVDFTAVFAVNDLTALGAMECLQQHGWSVPADVSVAGFDDIYLARYAAPALTTVRLPAYEMGKTATDLVIEAIEGKRERGEGRLFPVEVIARASTGPAPGTAG
ncbi:MAG TPA: LacI family DNA-binding transcriptional regulator [Thermomicrobiales bacterium]|nr:LacI family DNA-binding transcriptional regulator [Thermomicrobiales bacterium]